MPETAEEAIGITINFTSIIVPVLPNGTKTAVILFTQQAFAHVQVGKTIS
jgi:hypothetical protein